MNLDNVLNEANEQWNQELAQDFVIWGGKVMTIAAEHDDGCKCPPCVVAEGFFLYRKALAAKNEG